MVKENLRKKAIEKRKNLSVADRITADKKIQENLFSLFEFNSANTIMFYVSTKSEVHTHNLIIESQRQGKQIAVPLVDYETGEMSVSFLEDFHEHLEEKNGILEPKEEFVKLIDSDKIDLIIVPGIAFDERGERLGYGKGFYDKYLQHCENKPRIGIAYEVQIVPEIPSEPHDIRVTKIVTEDRIINCEENE